MRSLIIALLALPSLASSSLAQSAAVTQTGALRHLTLDDGFVVHSSAAAIDDVRTLTVADDLIVLWREGADAGQPHYRVRSSAGRWSRVRATDYELRLKLDRFDPLERSPERGATASLFPSGGELYIVQFVTQPLESFRRKLRELGAEVYGHLANHAHIVRMSPTTRNALSELDFVRWVGPYLPDYRMTNATREGLTELDPQAPQRYHIQVFERGPRQKQIVAERLVAEGAQIAALIPDGFLLEAWLTRSQLLNVLGWNEVQFIDPWSAPETDMNLVRANGGADSVESVTGFTGQGVRGECMDGNVIQHQDLQSNPILFHGPNVGTASHGTPVTGVVFGDGTGDPAARGVLPDGQPIFADYGQLNNRYTHTAQLLQAPYFAVFQTNSWGSSLTTAYTSLSSQMDDILFLNDIVILQSQSNAGSQLSRPQAWAKNIVSVGGIVHGNTPGLGNDFWGQTGSIGPAADGRIKPDLAFWNDAIYTTSSSGGYTNFGGTSAATPETAGFFGLFFQMWHENLFGTDPGGATVFDSRPHASTARAMMINAARTYEFSGLNDDLTRTHQGWGRPNVQRLYARRDDFFIVNEEVALEQFEEITYPLVINSNSLRVTMAYLDPAGTTSAAQHRINDLSVRAVSPSGTTYWGNNGLLVSPWSVPDGASNTLDVIENIFLQDPEPGVWQITVIADEINQDAHIDTLELDATFALVVSRTEGLADECIQPLTFCASSPNSVGDGAEIEWSGSNSIAANDLVLNTTGLPLGQFGLYFFGQTSTDLPFGDGRRCVANPFLRGPILPIDGAGSLAYDVDVSAPAVIAPGETWHYQLWYRDPAAMGATFNTSDALLVEWCD